MTFSLSVFEHNMSSFYCTHIIKQNFLFVSVTSCTYVLELCINGVYKSLWHRKNQTVQKCWLIKYVNVSHCVYLYHRYCTKLSFNELIWEQFSSSYSKYKLFAIISKKFFPLRFRLFLKCVYILCSELIRRLCTHWRLCALAELKSSAPLM